MHGLIAGKGNLPQICHNFWTDGDSRAQGLGIAHATYEGYRLSSDNSFSSINCDIAHLGTEVLLAGDFTTSITCRKRRIFNDQSGNGGSHFVIPLGRPVGTSEVAAAIHIFF